METTKFHARVSMKNGAFSVVIEEIDYVDFLVTDKDLIDSEVKRWINELEELAPSDFEVNYIWEKSAQSA